MRFGRRTPMAHETFRAGDLTAVIGDNETYPGHRAGYNGVHRLTHRTNPKSLFTVTGLNLEQYGFFGSHQYILMFDRTDGIRFSHSPSGGGPPSATEPAWDWQFIIPEYEVAHEYGYRARVIYRGHCCRDEVLQEYTNWRATLKN